MLKKDNRLSSKYEYYVVRKHGEHLKGAYVHVFTLKPNNYQGKTKFGIVVSRKVHKNAVVRNKLKRIYSDISRKALHNLKNLWIVVQPTAAAIGKSYEEISSDYDKILQKISVSG